MGVSFNSIFYFRQFNHHLSVIPACSRELMSCVGRLCKEYLYLYNSLPLIPTPPLIMAVNIGEAVGCLLPSKPPWVNITYVELSTDLCEVSQCTKKDPFNIVSQLDS